MASDLPYPNYNVNPSYPIGPPIGPLYGFPVTPPSLDQNPLFLGLLKRLEMLEARVNDLQSNPDKNKQAELRFA